jgi:surface antigen
LDLVDELGADDLYDAAIEPSGGIVKKESVDSASNQTPQQTNESSLGPSPAAVSSSTSVSSGSIRRYQCYVGNCTWWTTDDDLIVSF